MISKTTLSAFLGALVGKSGVGYPDSVYMALSTTDPSVDGSLISEPSGNGYARKRITTGYGANNSSHAFGNATYDDSTDTVTISNLYEIQFPKATGSWGTITHFALYSASSGGTMIAYGSLTNSISPVTDSVAIIEVGNAVLSIQQQ